MPELIAKLFNVTAWIVPVIILAAIVPAQAIRILREYERGVIFRLGSCSAPRPGLILLHFRSLTAMQKMTCASSRLRSQTGSHDSDNVPATVDAVVYFRIVDRLPQ